MGWFVGGVVLLAAGLLLRRLLGVFGSSSRTLTGLPPLSPDRLKLYEPIAREIETQDTILGVSLNDAFEERDGGHEDIAWHLIRLSASEWDRQQEIITDLLTAILEHQASLRVVIPMRNLSSREFKSPIMRDFVRVHELLDKLVFRSNLRFQLRLRVLRRAATTLTSDFRRAYRYGEGPDGRPPELWQRLDLLYHDFDRATKEILLAYRTFLFCLPHSALGLFAAELERLTCRAARSFSIQAHD